MPELIQMGYDEATERSLFLLPLEAPVDAPATIALPSPFFASLLVWDAGDVHASAITDLAARLLGAGCRYFCTWGTDCERVHDLIDEVCAIKDPDPTDASVIMTTWHVEDSLDDALFYFLVNTWPADNYFKDCRSGVVVSIGSDTERLLRIRFALDRPRAFIAETV